MAESGAPPSLGVLIFSHREHWGAFTVEVGPHSSCFAYLLNVTLTQVMATCSLQTPITRVCVWGGGHSNVPQWSEEIAGGGGIHKATELANSHISP